MANGTNWSAKKNSYYKQWRLKQKQKKEQNQPQSQPPATPPAQPPQSKLQTLIAAMKSSTAANTGAGNSWLGGGFHGTEGNANPDYNDNNNPALVKWQEQNDETKMARYLAKLSKQGTLPPDAQGYTYHYSNFQNMVHDMGLNAPVYAKLSAADFDKYCQENGLTPFYRGWEGGNASKERFESADMSHVGSGMYGEGFYFGIQSKAQHYAMKGGDWTAVTKAALSPKARVVDLSVVKQEIEKLNSNTQKSLQHAGAVPGSKYQDNIGYSQMALKMKYNVIRTSWCYLVLTRDAVVISE